MNEYINRESLLSAAKGYDWIAGLKTVMKRIPAADVRPVVHGRWVTRPYMMGQTEYCSRCGENYGRKHNFCPNCGADMREES